MTATPSCWLLTTIDGAKLAFSASKVLAEEAAFRLSACTGDRYAVVPLASPAMDDWHHPLPQLRDDTSLNPISAVQVTFDLQTGRRQTDIIWSLSALVWEDARLWGTTLLAISRCRVHAMHLIDCHLPLLQANLIHQRGDRGRGP